MRDYGDDKFMDYVTTNTLHAGRLRRYATWAVHHNQTIGEHCWQIARVYENIFGSLTADVEKTIRHHDTPELVVGDPPFPIKSKNPDLKTIYDRMEEKAYLAYGIKMPVLTPIEKSKVKICDLIEMMEFGLIEIQMGNKLAIPIVQRTRVAADKMANEKLDENDATKVHEYLSQLMYVHEQIMDSTA